MGSSQPNIASLEGGDVGATLTTIQKTAAALGMRITVELSATT